MLHAWTTEPSKVEWANSEGLSPEVWSEGMGWYSLVVPELLAVLPESHPDYGEIKSIYLKMAKGLKEGQAETPAVVHGRRQRHESTEFH